MSDLLSRLAEMVDQLWVEANGIWRDGGWAMLAIAVIAFVMFSVGFHVFTKLRRKGFLSTPEHVWRRWIDHPLERRGRIGDLLDAITGARTLEEVTIYFRELRTTESVPFERDLKVMHICVSAAPLVGLLGTVTGMLATFGALSSGAGGDQTMAMVASGISEALITTETGLVIALPGLFFQYQLTRQHDRYKAFLAHLESVCTQRLTRRLNEERRALAVRTAKRHVARKLAERMRARTTPAKAAEEELPPEPATTSH